VKVECAGGWAVCVGGVSWLREASYQSVDEGSCPSMSEGHIRWRARVVCVGRWGVEFWRRVVSVIGGRGRVQRWAALCSMVGGVVSIGERGRVYRQVRSYPSVDEGCMRRWGVTYWEASHPSVGEAMSVGRWGRVIW
jgi:hypothetical protein